MKQIEGSYRSSASPASLWGALSDPERLGEALPEVGFVDVHDADSFSANVRPSTNLGITALALDVRIAERSEGERVRILGDGVAGEHRVSFDVVLRLAAADAGRTEVTWSASVQAFGGLGSLTQRVLPMLLRDQVTIVLKAAEAQAEAVA